MKVLREWMEEFDSYDTHEKIIMTMCGMPAFILVIAEVSCIIAMFL